MTRNDAHRSCGMGFGERSDERTVRPGEARLVRLAPEHGQLVTQHEDLGVLRYGVHSMEADASSTPRTRR